MVRRVGDSDGGRRPVDGDVGDGGADDGVRGAAAGGADAGAGGVEHDHGGTRTGTSGTGTGGAHGTRPTVAARIAARALGLLGAMMVAVVMVMVVQLAGGHRAVAHLVDVLVIVLAGGRTGVAAPI